MMKKEFESAHAELAYRQKKFIPVNIIVTVISLLAALTLIFAPFFSINLGQFIVAAMQSDDGITSDGGNTSNGDSDEATDSENTEELEAIMEIVMSGTNSTIHIGLNDMFKGLKSNNPLNVVLYSKMTGKDGILENIYLNSLGLGIALVLAIPSDAELSLEELKEAVNVNAINSAIRKAETDEQASAEEFCAAINNISKALNYDVSLDFNEEFQEAFDEMLTKGKNGNSAFSVERFVCTSIGGEDCDTYDKLIEKQFSQINSTMEEQKGAVDTALTVMTIIVLFPALMWLLLAILAGTHILRKKKIFATWYVEAFGFIPCIIFGIVPLAIGKAVPDVAAMFSAFSSMTWISGGCFIALVLLLWFYLYRTRRNIKRLIYEAANEPVTEPAPKTDNESVSEITTNDSVAESTAKSDCEPTDENKDSQP